MPARRPFVRSSLPLLVFLTAPPLAAQTGPPVKTVSVAEAKKAVLRPDLVVTINPAAGIPTEFVVKNLGPGAADASVLKITTVWVPPASNVDFSGGGCSSAPASGLDFMANLEAALQAALCDAFSAESVKALCGEPPADTVQAIPPLKNGESKSYVAVKLPAIQLRKAFGRVRTALPPAPATYLKEVKASLTLVCAFDVTATADASKQVAEASETNNTATRRIYREAPIQ